MTACSGRWDRGESGASSEWSFRFASDLRNLSALVDRQACRPNEHGARRRDDKDGRVAVLSRVFERRALTSGSIPGEGRLLGTNANDKEDDGRVRMTRR